MFVEKLQDSVGEPWPLSCCSPPSSDGQTINILGAQEHRTPDAWDCHRNADQLERFGGSMGSVPLVVCGNVKDLNPAIAQGMASGGRAVFFSHRWPDLLL